MKFRVKYLWPYVIFIITITVLVYANSIVTVNGSKDLEHYANTINVAGKQRMISQKLFSNAILLNTNQAPILTDNEELEFWNQRHFVLQVGNDSLGFANLSENNELLNRFTVLNEIQQHFYLTYKQFLNTPTNDSTLQKIRLLQGAYLKNMDDIVLLIQRRSEKISQDVLYNQIFTALFSGLILLVEIILIIIPNHKKLIESIEIIQDQKDALLQSEQKFRSFFENSRGLMCIHDLQGNFIKVNTSGAKLIGYTPEELEGKNLYYIVPEKYHKTVKLYLQKIEKDQYYTGKLVVKHKNGQQFTWLFHNIIERFDQQKTLVYGNAIDITQQQELELNLQQIQQRLELTNKIANIGGWEVDLINNTVFWSEITRQIHRVPATFVPNLNDGINFYKEGYSRDKIKEVVENGMLKGLAWDEELQIVTSDGEEVWVRAIGSPVFNGDKCVKLVGTFQDIDTVKKAQIEILKSRKEFANILESASEISIISTDENGIIRVFSKGAENLLGYTAAEMEGKCTPALIHDKTEVEKRGQELSAEYGISISGFRVFVHKSELVGIEQREWTYVKKNGTKISVSLVVSCIRDDKNNVIGYLGIARDISKEKEAIKDLVYEKSRLQAFVEHAPAAVAMFDTQIRYLAVSKRWVEDYKLEHTEIIGKSHYEVFPNISDEWKQIHQNCLSGAVQKNDEDSWIPEGWTHRQYLKWEVRPWFLSDGSIGGIMMFTQDITENCLQREELKHAKAIAEQSSNAKSEFLANMSHEIRTPLNGIIGFTDLLLKSNLNEIQKNYLSIINQSGNTLLSIINDILDFSKIEAGKMDLNIAKSDLYSITSDVIDMITFQTHAKQIEVLLNVDNDLPRYIWADEIRLKQVMLNLLSNSVKFTERGEIELKIQIKEVLHSDEIKLYFEIRDTGIGINPDKQQKIFEAFTQEDSSITKKYGGTGLGLTISNKLLNLMNSKLQLTSEVGVGTKFYFELIVKAEAENKADINLSTNIKNALVIDDNYNNRLIIKKMLALKNITTDEAANGFDAIEMFNNNKTYDVIIVDFHMPEMDGIQVIKKLKEIHARKSNNELFVMLYSSSSEQELINQCEQIGVKQRLVKPVKIRELFQVLNSINSAESTVVEDTLDDQKNNHTINASQSKILLVEDNHINMLLIDNIVSKVLPNAKIYKAINGNEAVEFCKKNTPDLVFMDVQMPVLNGYEATKSIRNELHLNHIPIIALTAGNVKGEREKCIESGMNDFLTKPFIEDQIVKMLNKWLSQENSSNIKLSHFNPIRLTSIIEDNEGLIHLLNICVIELNEITQKCSNSIESNDLTLLSEHAHGLKGVSANIGAEMLAEIAAQLENYTSFSNEELRLLLNKLIEEKNITVALINNYKNELEN